MKVRSIIAAYIVLVTIGIVFIAAIDAGVLAGLHLTVIGSGSRLP